MSPAKQETGGPTQYEQIESERFARRLHQLMLEKGMSQSDLAREIWGTTTNAQGRNVARNRDRISVYLKGDTIPETKNLGLLAKALGVEPHELAPDIMASAVDRENPEIAMTAIAGHADKVHLRVNKLVPLPIAAKIIDMLSDV